MSTPYSLMVHGGAMLAPAGRPGAAEQAACLDSLHDILERGRTLLAAGGSALAAVEHCACLLEDDPLFNAGRGSVLNVHGRVEMDAAIMDGRDLAAGAVAAVTGIANPVRLARQVMTHSAHMLLVGTGALQFARKLGVSRVTQAYLVTARRRQEYRDTCTAGGREANDHTRGTIGAVARDCQGNLAAATSTGGMLGKLAGRVGDSPIIGAGVYADNASCAVSATGHGEDLLRTVLAKAIADRVELLGLDAARAAQAGIDYLQERAGGQGGVIVIDAAGHCASRFTSGQMLHGWIEREGVTVCSAMEEKS